jgi:hypothetical protein
MLRHRAFLDLCRYQRASARCADALATLELFQQFVVRPGKPLKRLTIPRASIPRAKATVLMRGSCVGCATLCRDCGRLKEPRSRVRQPELHLSRRA